MFFKREAIADTFALITFGLVVGMFVELFVAGLTLEQSIQSRLMSIPVNLLIARPYGIYRDWVIDWNVPGKKNFLGSTLLDIIAFISFQIPVYAVLVGTTGAGIDQVMTACIGQIGAMVVMGRPFGLWMQMCRHWFNGSERAVEIV
ncbi:hypothetical protein ACH42_11350 [Endozoicomonas sp. (ex Bugula neritina AB1)]|nr:hypothetical protein ACH42_11350 [Endozoicomonas sp. (ex Bugula neritina AB1)]